MAEPVLSQQSSPLSGVHFGSNRRIMYSEAACEVMHTSLVEHAYVGVLPE